jgi:hypothetical protein
MLSDRDSERGRSKVAIVTRGTFSEALRPLVRQAGLELQPVVSPRELSGEPVGVIVPLDSSPEVWAELQEDPAYGAIPLLGLAQGANELSFAETFARGGEDLLALGAPEDALAKLRAIPVPAQRPEPSGHRVLVVSEDAGWRASAARRLRGAGIEAIFAATEAELGASAGGVALAVIDGRRQPEQAVAMARALRGVVSVPTLVSVPQSDLRATSEALRGIENAAVHDAFGLADALLFLVNEALAGSIQERRRSPRMLFGTSVWLRAAGGEQDHLGYSYTISEGGLFVRSMAPLAVGTGVWVEVSPPRTGRRVRLAATVVWARGFGPRSRAISPPGMGLRIDGGLPGEWELFQQGCRALLG